MPAMTKPPRASGKWLAPVLLAVGVAVAIAGAWVMKTSRAKAGAYFEVLATDGPYAVALRRQDGVDRAFVELIEIGKGVRWQALIPPYAGTPTAPGLAASPTAVTVRVARNGHDELWALSTEDSEKLGQLHLEPGPAATGVRAPGVVTVADAVDSYEFSGATDRATSVVAIELARGAPLWRVVLPPRTVRGAWIDAQTLWIETDQGTLGLDRASGKTVDRPAPAHDAGAAMRQAIGPRAWPADAIAPAPHHLGKAGMWIVRPDRLQLVARDTFAQVTEIVAE